MMKAEAKLFNEALWLIRYSTKSHLNQGTRRFYLVEAFRRLEQLDPQRELPQFLLDGLREDLTPAKIGEAGFSLPRLPEKARDWILRELSYAWADARKFYFHADPEDGENVHYHCGVAYGLALFDIMNCCHV